MSASTKMNPPPLPGVLPFRCPRDLWTQPTRLAEPAPPNAWIMVRSTLGTVRPGKAAIDDHWMNTLERILQ